MIGCEQMTHGYGSLLIFKDLSFKIPSGCRASIVGPNGCGKTTLLKLLAGLLSSSGGGKICVESSSVGMAFQQSALFDNMTVEENLIFALGRNFEEGRSKELLEAVQLQESPHLYPHELSGGMRRRVGLIRALAMNSQVLLFDEPTAGLDPISTTMIVQMLREHLFKLKASTALLATTQVDVALRFSERLLVLSPQGELMGDGSWQELMEKASPWVRHFLTARSSGWSKDLQEEFPIPLSSSAPNGLSISF